MITHSPSNPDGPPWWRQGWRVVCLAVASFLLAGLRLGAQSYVDPADALGIWDFNNASVTTQSNDSMYGTPMVFVSGTAFSADAGGRSGLSGDRSVNFGTAAGNYAHVTDSAFLALLNQKIAAKDQLTVVFWEKWSTAPAASSAVYFKSTSASGTNRGFQAHVPYSDNVVYFDTAGCCTASAQRLNASITTLFPSMNWQTWHHVALVKSGGIKQIWIDGQLLTSQAGGASALPGDMTEFIVGMLYSTTNSFHGTMDDLAVFSTALTQAQIVSLAGGASPGSLVVPPENRPPVIGGLSPADGASFQSTSTPISFTVTTVSPNTIPAANIHLAVNNIDVTSSLVVGGTETNRTATYSVPLTAGRFYSVKADVTDNSSRASSQTWSFDTADAGVTPLHPALDLVSLGTPVLSAAAAGSGASLALDNNAATVAETPNVAGSYFELDLVRSMRLSRIYLTAPGGAGYGGVLNNLVVRVYDMRDQLVYETTVSGVQAGQTWAAFLPAGINGRIIRVELPAGQTNGAGDYRVAVADIKVYGDPSPTYGPLNLPAIATLTQSSTNSTNTAALAVDGNGSTVSETADALDSYFLITLDRGRPVRRIEIVNRADANTARLAGLTVRFLDANSGTVAVTTTTNPGTSATWGFDLPAGAADVRAVRIGLEGGATNGQGNRIVSLAEVSLFTGSNYALGATSYMVRLIDTLPAASLANDGNWATSTETTQQTVDGYWETDLGTLRAIYSVRATAYDSGDNLIRLRHATVRLFDQNHESVWSQHLTGNSGFFDVVTPGPVNARYVRVGFENKERSSLTGGVEWYLRLREVQAFGVPSTDPGLHSFAAVPPAVNSGQASVLSWQETDLTDLAVYPGAGSVGGQTDASGHGTLNVSPVATTEYVLVGQGAGGPAVKYATVQVDGLAAPPRLTEIMASNKLSLRDGYKDAPDWIEIHNPNDSVLDLGGYFLSDNATNPLKWSFPAGTTIAAHGYLIVFASGDDIAADPAGYLHCDFNLNSEGESVLLTAPNGTTLVDSIASYPAQDEDLAYGRALDGTLGFLAPTPGAVNAATALEGWLAPPTFSHSRGFYESGFSLVLANPNPGADLLYSLDGTEPSLAYTGQINVSGSVTVRANVRRTGYHSPRTVTHTYLFKNSVMSSPLMNTTYTQGTLSTRLRNSLGQLPTICVSVPALPDDYNEREASIEVILPDGSTPIQFNAGFVRFGGSWTLYAKKSYRVRFRNEFGARRLETPLLRGFDHGFPAMDQIDTLDLSAGNQDMVERGFYVANRFVEDTMLDMGSLNPHGRFVHVYINGVYWGQYNAHERMEDSFLADYIGGESEDYTNVAGNDNSGSNFVPGIAEEPNRLAWEAARASRTSYATARNHIDIRHLIDFMLLWNYGYCETEFRAAGPVTPGTSGFKFWLADADGFLRTAALTANNTGNTGPGGIFGALVAEGHPDFKMLVADRIYKHFFNGGALTYEKNLARLNARMTEIQDSLIAECARWGYRTPDNWVSAADTIRTGLFPQRTSNLFGYLRNAGLYPTIDPPTLSQFGGTVSDGYTLNMTSGAGTIYYTLDGSDPRLPGGGVSATAQVASVTANTHVALGSAWKYWDQGSLPASNWYAAAYSDAAWASGNAPLGYGTGDEGTTVSYGAYANAKYPTTYFRKSFTVANPATITSLTLGLARDDGAIVYLNGTEVVRDNMPAGTVGYGTYAAATVSGDVEKKLVRTFTVSPSLLVAGTNLLAVEVHQASATSSDLRMDVSLTDSTIPSIVLHQSTNLKTRFHNGTTWSALSEAVFNVAHPLATAGPYVMTQWAASQAAGSYPANTRFFQTSTPDPGIDTAMEEAWTLPYNLTSRSRINGLGADGIGFVNTGNTQAVQGAGYVGSAVLSLDTRNTQDVRVTWTGGTIAPNDRDQGIRLQYRVGGTGSWLDVPGPGGAAVEYLRNATAGHSAIIGPTTLPVACENQSLVELRWKYYFRSGTSGARAQLRLDDIQVTAGPVVAESLAIVEAPATAQAGSPAGPVTVQVRGRNNALAETYASPVLVSLLGHAGMLGGTVSRTPVNGVVVFDDLVFPQAGSFTIVVSSGALTGAANASATQVLGLTELVMPRYIEGEQPDNNNRVPFACLLRIEGLNPNATYRFANQIVNDEDTRTQEGAGNMIFTTTAGAFTRTTESPRFLAGDLNIRYGEFVADGSGRHTGWFVSEPTGNVRFDPGGLVRVRLLLNDGASGDISWHFLTTSGTAQVLAFGNGPAQGTAFHGRTGAAARSFLVLHDSADGSTRPLGVALVEATGASSDARYAPFYQSLVAGQAGHWGTILPNNLPNGIRRIEERALADGALVSVLGSADGITPSIGVSGGDPVGLVVPGAGGSGFAAWQAVRFSLGQIDDPATGGALGDPDRDGVPNLLEFAFGRDPLQPVAEKTPDCVVERSGGQLFLVFRYHRRTDGGGLGYQPQVSTDGQLWQDASGLWSGGEETTPDAGGLTETVARRLPIDAAHPVRFARVLVTMP